MDPEQEPGINVAQVFLERVVFSHREDFLSLPANTQANVGDVAVTITTGERQDREAGLIRIEVKTKPENKPIYNVELVMVALVNRLPGKENMTIREFLSSPASISLLYPFLREAFANVTLRGRFGAVWLNPINPQMIASELTQRSQLNEPHSAPTPSSDPLNDSLDVASQPAKRPRGRAHPD